MENIDEFMRQEFAGQLNEADNIEIFSDGV